MTLECGIEFHKWEMGGPPGFGLSLTNSRRWHDSGGLRVVAPLAWLVHRLCRSNAPEARRLPSFRQKTRRSTWPMPDAARNRRRDGRRDAGGNP